MGSDKVIYVIDDEKDVCEFVKITLETRGMKVLCEYDGESGLKLIHKQKPDLVILDLKMPKMNGYEVVTALKKDPQFQDLPIIIITSLTQESKKSDEQWRKALGVNDFITKPFDPLQLAHKVDLIFKTEN